MWICRKSSYFQFKITTFPFSEIYTSICTYMVQSSTCFIGLAQWSVFSNESSLYMCLVIWRRRCVDKWLASTQQKVMPQIKKLNNIPQTFAISSFKNYCHASVILVTLQPTTPRGDDLAKYIHHLKTKLTALININYILNSIIKWYNYFILLFCLLRISIHITRMRKCSCIFA